MGASRVAGRRFLRRAVADIGKHLLVAGVGLFFLAPFLGPGGVIHSSRCRTSSPTRATTFRA